jgi:RNA polymerase sigma-70 factor (ECF subfamily)
LPEEFTDEALLAAARGGDEGSFLALYERHHAYLFRFACRLLGSVHAAEDAVHDCFVELIERPGFDPARGPLRNYLYGAVRHRAHRQFRRAGREVELGEDERGRAGAESDEPLGRLLGEELGEVVRAAIQSLPPLQRETLVLYEYEELSLAEIAEIASTDVGTIKGRLWRARTNLRRQLAPYLFAGAEALAVKD